MRKPGCIEPVIYFRHPDDHLTLAPYSDFPTPEGAIREYADTLAAVDRLQATLVAQEKREWEREVQRDAATFGARMDEVRDRLYARMTSSATSEFEREFIRLYLQLRNDKRAVYQQRWLERTAYLWARENDSGSRPVDSEEFHPDRINVKT
jgi:hypothetical protein